MQYDSASASACNLFLIWDLQRWTGYMKLIAWMTAFQLLYDCSFYTNVTSAPGTVDCYVGDVLDVISGCTSAFLSNVMMITVLYIVRYKKSVAIENSMTLILLVANIPSLYMLAIFLYAILTSDESLVKVVQASYCYIRLASILLNILPYIYMSYLLHISSSSRAGSMTRASVQEMVIQTLVSRLSYYPLIQALSRSATTWFELQYGFDFSNPNASFTQYVISMSTAVCYQLTHTHTHSITFSLTRSLALTHSFAFVQYSKHLLQVLCPLVSIGYLAIFLVMQPRAYLHLKSRVLTCKRYQQPQQPELFKAQYNNQQQQQQQTVHNPTLDVRMYISTIQSRCSEGESNDDDDSSTSSMSSVARSTLLHEVNALDECDLIEILNRPIRPSLAAPGVESGSVTRDDDVSAFSTPSRTSLGRHTFDFRRSDSSIEI